MALTYWDNKTCGNCGLVSPIDLPIYHCEECGVDKCPSCGGGKSEDGNITMCRSCAIKQLPAILADDLAERQLP